MTPADLDVARILLNKLGSLRSQIAIVRSANVLKFSNGDQSVLVGQVGATSVLGLPAAMIAARAVAVGEIERKIRETKAELDRLGVTE
jgi:hypothetical protein